MADERDELVPGDPELVAVLGLAGQMPPQDGVVGRFLLVETMEGAFRQMKQPLAVEVRVAVRGIERVEGHRRAPAAERILDDAADDELTFFKSVGNAVQDLAVAAVALERAEKDGLGQLLEL